MASGPPLRLGARLVLVAVALAVIPRPADALVLCARVKKGQPGGALSLRQQCKGHETVVDPAALGLQVAGPPGPPGADGQLRIYGDGSAGARTVTADETLADANLQYTDFTVVAGVTLTVSSGTVVRCTGTFTNGGTIVVSTGAGGASCRSSSTSIDTAYGPPGQGVARGLAGRGEYGPGGTFRFGGIGSTGLTEVEARQVLRPGNGACGSLGEGSPGGGGFTVLAAGPVVNDGTLRADGGGPGGEGAGGGIVHVLAPLIDDTGTTSVAGGISGSGCTSAAGARFGGGAGGACGGAGGTGGSVGSNNLTTGGIHSGDGHLLETLVDPAALF